MSGTLISDFSVSDVNLTNMMATLDSMRKGHFQLSITNFDTDSEADIAAGSIIDINGALYAFDSDEAITGSISDGDSYIVLVPSGSTATAQYSNDDPIWDSSKQGWYGTGARGNYRYIVKFAKDGSDYKNKKYMNKEEFERLIATEFYDSGDIAWAPAAVKTAIFTFDFNVEAVLNHTVTIKGGSGVPPSNYVYINDFAISGTDVEIEYSHDSAVSYSNVQLTVSLTCIGK